MFITVTFQGRRITVPFESEYEQFGDNWTKAVTLQMLKDKMTGLTGLHGDSFKLLAHGGGGMDVNTPFGCFRVPGLWQSRNEVTMTDPNATLSFYHLSSGSKVIMIKDRVPSSSSAHNRAPNGYTPVQTHASAQSSGSANARSGASAAGSNSGTNPPSLSPEQTIVNQIDGYMEPVAKTLEPMLSKFESHVHELDIMIRPSTSTSSTDDASQHRDASPSTPQLPPSSPHAVYQKRVCDEHAKISELLLQVLIKIDGVECPSNMGDARTHRKSAVKRVQSLMDENDRIMAKANQAFALVARK